MKKDLTGKKRAVLHAFREGLTGQTIAMPAAELAAYKEHVKKFFDDCQPANPTEKFLVQTIASTSWRRNRLVALETNLLNEAIAELQKSVPADQPPLSHEDAMHIAYFDQIHILEQLGKHQERLSIMFSKSIRQLTKIQAIRRGIEKKQMKEAAGRAQDDFDRGNCYRA